MQDIKKNPTLNFIKVWFTQDSGFYRVRFWQATLYLLDILIIAKWNLYLMRNMHNSIHMVVCFSAVFSFVVDLRSVEYITLKLKIKTNLIKIRHWIAICSPPPPPSFSDMSRSMNDISEKGDSRSIFDWIEWKEDSHTCTSMLF